MGQAQLSARPAQQSPHEQSLLQDPLWSIWSLSSQTPNFGHSPAAYKSAEPARPWQQSRDFITVTFLSASTERCRYLPYWHGGDHTAIARWIQL